MRHDQQRPDPRRHERQHGRGERPESREDIYGYQPGGHDDPLQRGRQENLAYPDDDEYTARRAAGRARPTLPKGYARSDERIREDVCERLSHSGMDVAEVSVSVSQGEVTLEGSVRDRYLKHAIENCADHCLGVKDVHNHLRVMPRPGV